MKTTKRLARDIMSTDVITVSTGTDLRDLARMFLEKGITGAPVVDDRGELAGVVSQTDLVYYNMTRGDELVMDSTFYQAARMEGGHLRAGFQVEDFNSGIVADVMTPVVHSVTETATVESVARLMTREHIHRVIVRRGRKPTGVISALDVIRSGQGRASRRAPATRTKATPKKKKTARRTTSRARA